MSVVVAALYKFTRLADYRELREPLLDECLRLGVRGTLLLAEEGINGTIAGDRSAIDAVLAWLRRDPRLADIEHKESEDEALPFYRMKVKLKREIVTLGVPGVDPNARVGTYVAPTEWNRVVNDPDVVLVDTRNHYEYGIGSFRGALDPGTSSFREFPEWVKNNLDPTRNPRVAMFCTGGIRCEKASSYLLQQGFETVYHLRGGVLKYLEEVPEAESTWEGECFVFDNRVSVNHRLEKGEYDQCHGCRRPITQDDKLSERYQKGVCCPACFDELTTDQKTRFAERQKQVELARVRGEQHLGADCAASQRERSAISMEE
ncbi:UPF0176 protein [Chromatocurvus halotolerans]|uniref:tRNA uridine(34) hydroxylase n=2 Tax=Chromatocurvus halotolerans TaxID=1132028 RepID=A0A4R2KUU0_9GAMM|nr:UPF0176 protein [Chromatocurvus halotolerans]